jgi:TetR/AcrR family transcriptional regulator
VGDQDATTLQKIICEGKKEFLEKGFQEASLRNIVKRAGVTTGAFYGYYPDKAALFEALVSPAVQGLKELFLSAQRDFDGLPGDTKRETVNNYSSGQLKEFVAYIYEHLDEFKLLINCAGGTAFTDFIHQLVEIEVEYTLKFIATTGNDALTAGRVTPEFLHIISSAYFSAIFEVVAHDMTKEGADSYIDRLEHFFKAGWNTILNP